MTMQEDRAASTVQSGSIPVAVLPDVETLLNEPIAGNPHHAPIARLIGALGRIPAWDEPEHRANAFREAQAAAQYLLAAIGRAPYEHDVEPLTPAQDYFHVRTHRLDAEECLVQVAVVVNNVIKELGSAPMAGNDIALLVEAMGAVLGEFLGDGAEADHVVDLADEPVVGPDPNLSIEQRWFRRWIIAHQFHSLLNTFSAAALKHAVGHLRDGSTRAAIERIKHTTAYVDAIAPVRAFALCHPPVHYELVYRPSMLPPLVPVALHGRLHPEYKVYRAAMDELLEELPTPVVDLAKTELELALARERLLNADLHDAERHITLVWTMVGNKKALAQTTRTPDNALGALRGMRDRRAAQFAPFLRFSHNDHSYES